LSPFVMAVLEDVQRAAHFAVSNPLLFVYELIQWFLSVVLSPTPPPPHTHLQRPKIAVIGAGLTGVSAASHCVGHGFEATIFEKGNRESVGGIWSVCIALVVPPLGC
jgi:NADPH-dependent 2,4-dienoyl-CoA reductase/sulfur reductase-like enzyme